MGYIGPWPERQPEKYSFYFWHSSCDINRNERSGRNSNLSVSVLSHTEAEWESAAVVGGRRRSVCCFAPWLWWCCRMFLPNDSSSEEIWAGLPTSTTLFGQETKLSTSAIGSVSNTCAYNTLRSTLICFSIYLNYYLFPFIMHIFIIYQ